MRNPEVVDADGAGSFVYRAPQIDRIAARAFGQKRNRRHGNAFVRDANSDFVADLIDRAHQVRGHALDLFPHAIRGALDRFGYAVAQTQAQRYGANVEMFHLSHAHGLQDFSLRIFHNNQPQRRGDSEKETRRNKRGQFLLPDRFLSVSVTLWLLIPSLY